MKLRNKLWLGMGAAFLALFLLFEWNDYQESRANILTELREQAHILNTVLMATRRTYQHVFLNSGMPLNEQTLSFLPAHTMGEISRNFRLWMRNGMTFNNVSDRPRNPANQADAVELEAMAYFRASPKSTERFVPFTAPDGAAYYHYSTPIWMEGHCLKCHGDPAQAPELITTSPEAFIARAVAFATTDRLGLHEMRQRLIANRDTCTLFDIDGLTRKLEALYAQMADEYRAGALPRPNIANLSAYLDIGVNIDHDSAEIGAAADYHAIYRAALADRHYNTPMQADGRLWTQNEIGAAEAAPIRNSTSRAA